MGGGKRCQCDDPVAFFVPSVGNKTLMLLPPFPPSLPPSLPPSFPSYLNEERNLPASPSGASSRP